MLETLNHRVQQFLSAPPDLSGGALLAALGLADWAILIAPALLVLLWIFGDAPDRRVAVRACLSGFVALGMAAAISETVFHPRPFMDGLAHNYLRHAPDSSFPSDHATLLFALGWSLLAARPPIMRRVWLVPFCLAVAVGWARVYLGAHYPLDIVGAALVALGATALLTIPAMRRASDAATGLGEKLYAWPLGAARSDNG